MSEITSEQRLQLLNQIRQEHNQNRQTIRSRENFIYGNSSSIPLNSSKLSYMDEYIENKEITGKKTHEEVTFSHSTFGLRMLIAALLLVGYFFLENSQTSLGFLDAEAIRTEVNRYSGAEINLFDFMDNITYTFNND